MPYTGTLIEVGRETWLQSDCKWPVIYMIIACNTYIESKVIRKIFPLLIESL